MTSASRHGTICYIATELPALSATFVYEEILALEQRGYAVSAISILRPANPATGHEELAARVHCLYDRPAWHIALTGFLGLWENGRGALTALRWLVADLISCGIHRIASWKLAFQLLAAVKVAKILREEKCQHLHAHFACVPAQIAMYASAMSGVPFTITAHANDIFERGRLLRQKAERATRMLTISEFNRAYLEHIGVHTNKLAVVRCGVSFESRPRSISIEHRDRYRIGTLGRLVEKKGMDVLIKAIAALKNRPYKVELAIGGDGPLRNDLIALVQTMGMSEIVCFEGNLAHHQVSDWLQDLDLFVLACKQDKNGDMDGIPVVLMEAMSQHVPVIATRLSGIPELVIHEQTGLLAAPNDHQELAQQIDRLLSSPELSKTLSSLGAMHVQDEFSQSVNIDRLIMYLAG